MTVLQGSKRKTDVLLENKVAVIYGGGGAIGRAVARAFAREGAAVYLAGRTFETLEPVMDQIRQEGGHARARTVDALDENSVNAFVESVVNETGRLDISFNLISNQDVQQALLEIPVEDFLQPIHNAMRSHFLTIRAAARYMRERRSGAILMFGGGGPQTFPGLGGFKVALDAMESLRRQWAIELGQDGIRVVTLKTGGIPETIPPDSPMREPIEASIRDATLLKRVATLEDVGNVAAFAASDRAATITSTDINISCGSIVD
jgi:3-oxoacyl-[acyl-carrier protein] reductase